jgi:hypothetical protein
MSTLGLDFSKIKKITDFNNLSGGGIVYKNSYNNPKSRQFIKSTTRQVVNPAMRSIVVDCIKDEVDDYDVVVSRLESAGLDSVKESYWVMALRAFSYIDIDSESDVDGWIKSPKDIKTYMEAI